MLSNVHNLIQLVIQLIQVIRRRVFSARTPLSCQSSCVLPTLQSIPAIGSKSQPVRISASVYWHECESIYVACPFGSILATYNSFIDTIRVYNISATTVYCGIYQQYYVVYTNNQDVNNTKNCSNTFDVIDCIGNIDTVKQLILSQIEF